MLMIRGPFYELSRTWPVPRLSVYIVCFTRLGNSGGFHRLALVVKTAEVRDKSWSQTVSQVVCPINEVLYMDFTCSRAAQRAYIAMQHTLCNST
jgi:hypothetical protein